MIRDVFLNPRPTSRQSCSCSAVYCPARLEHYTDTASSHEAKILKILQQMMMLQNELQLRLTARDILLCFGSSQSSSLDSTRAEGHYQWFLQLFTESVCSVEECRKFIVDPGYYRLCSMLQTTLFHGNVVLPLTGPVAAELVNSMILTEFIQHNRLILHSFSTRPLLEAWGGVAGIQTHDKPAVVFFVTPAFLRLTDDVLDVMVRYCLYQRFLPTTSRLAMICASCFTPPDVGKLQRRVVIDNIMMIAEAHPERFRVQSLEKVAISSFNHIRRTHVGDLVVALSDGEVGNPVDPNEQEDQCTSAQWMIFVNQFLERLELSQNGRYGMGMCVKFLGTDEVRCLSLGQIEWMVQLALTRGILNYDRRTRLVSVCRPMHPTASIFRSRSAFLQFA